MKRSPQISRLESTLIKIALIGVFGGLIWLNRGDPFEPPPVRSAELQQRVDACRDRWEEHDTRWRGDEYPWTCEFTARQGHVCPDGTRLEPGVYRYATSRQVSGARYGSWEVLCARPQLDRPDSIWRDIARGMTGNHARTRHEQDWRKAPLGYEPLFADECREQPFVRMFLEGRPDWIDGLEDLSAHPDELRVARQMEGEAFQRWVDAWGEGAEGVNLDEGVPPWSAVGAERFIDVAASDAHVRGMLVLVFQQLDDVIELQACEPVAFGVGTYRQTGSEWDYEPEIRSIAVGPE